MVQSNNCCMSDSLCGLPSPLFGNHSLHTITPYKWSPLVSKENTSRGGNKIKNKNLKMTCHALRLPLLDANNAFFILWAIRCGLVGSNQHYIVKCIEHVQYIKLSIVHKNVAFYYSVHHIKSRKLNQCRSFRII